MTLEESLVQVLKNLALSKFRQPSLWQILKSATAELATKLILEIILPVELGQ